MKKPEITRRKENTLSHKIEAELKQCESKYDCSLGNASGWCDGTDSKSCISYLKDGKDGGCELAL